MFGLPFDFFHGVPFYFQLYTISSLSFKFCLKFLPSLITMNDNFDVLAGELAKWTRTMLINFILNKSLPASCKISDDLQSALLSTSDNISLPGDETVNVAHILKSVVTRD